jgi:hypothetical protein
MATYYDDDEQSAPRPGAEQGQEQQPEQEGEEGDQDHGQSALLPKSVFPHEPEIGDECSFKVVALHDKDVSVEYVNHEEEEGGDGGEEGPPEASPEPEPGGDMYS